MFTVEIERRGCDKRAAFEVVLDLVLRVNLAIRTEQNVQVVVANVIHKGFSSLAFSCCFDKAQYLCGQNESLIVITLFYLLHH